MPTEGVDPAETALSVVEYSNLTSPFQYLRTSHLSVAAGVFGKRGLRVVSVAHVTPALDCHRIKS
jgi:hypothetical protein